MSGVTRFSLAALASLTALFGIVHDRVPLRKQELSTSRFKMTRHQYLCRTEGYKIGEVTFLPDRSGSIRLAGFDRNSKPWSLDVATDACTFWQADFDRDGTQDFIFFYTTGVKQPILVAVLFDSEGRPVPWMMTGSFEADDEGILDIVDLDHNGHAELLYTMYSSSWSKYWVTQLYEASGGYWQAVRHPVGGRTFPIYTENSNKAVTPEYAKGLPDFSNAFSEPVAFERFIPREVPECPTTLLLPETIGTAAAIDACHDWVVFEGDRSCMAPAIVIWDRPNERVIGIKDLLSAIERKSTVRSAGQRSGSHPCAPYYMWVTGRGRKSQ